MSTSGETPIEEDQEWEEVLHGKKKSKQKSNVSVKNSHQSTASGSGSCRPIYTAALNTKQNAPAKKSYSAVTGSGPMKLQQNPPMKNSRQSASGSGSSIPFNAVQSAFAENKDPADEYENSRSILQLARKELKEDPRQAGEKAWLAADMAMKELVEKFGLSSEPLNHHANKETFANKLEEHFGGKIGTFFDRAKRLHSNFYNGLLNMNQVNTRMDDVGKFIEFVGNISTTSNDIKGIIDDLPAKPPKK